MKKGVIARPWTDAEHRRMLKMKAEGHKWPAIGAALGRTEYAVAARYREHASDGGISRNVRKAQSEAFIARQAIYDLPPRSLTAEFFGDPLPGRSALDRRNAKPESRSISLAEHA
ncbi:hypothetical protein [Bradyrhizobium sp. USDA 4545]|uniref:hypothetical protein n=1 Tax=Bradyrhizobium sp. USDA 4545 TaxID=2817705 RepID=UPI0020A32E8E|nr:hypothetical protein [Bradyrhizobium sp. USDA 4545]MCP1832802.1 hypothetical protein [Bradyrhizobium sp. USDA 4545]